MQIKRINAWFKTATRYDVNNLLKINAADIDKIISYIQTMPIE